MSKKPFLPRRVEQLVPFHDNLHTQTVALVGQAGITTGDGTESANDNAELHAKDADVTAADSLKQAKVATRKTTIDTVVTNVRAFARRVKAHAGYTNAIGQQLGIIGEEDTTDLTNAKPTLKVLGAAIAGDLKIDFNKSVSDGVIIESKRGNETGFTFLAIDMEPDYRDTRANLAAGPETRQFRARYMLNDSPIGNYSDVLTVTVPGTSGPV